ncbi:hypothetical protein ACFOD0_06310 [Shewanella intestini]|uniref:Signal transduction histidine kinase dimerisation/phosphoacceptor domain-containing protein n=1 Tax=Shewanella intestini TaxID=2017544 RepID=A0ABS5HXS3_9GAMM|nr:MULTISPECIES: hypothetical protein [Shewanella]MBR9726492.1 hypothetical protein [Shewanella intestini]MRG34942.1 hypothetical protein [Shewanella sp. XMDDZSB0408]
MASITHEINTPIGICVTAASHLSQSVSLFNQKYQNDDVSHEEFEAYQDEVSQCTRLMLSNLTRAPILIPSSKKVSVDQSHEDLRDVNLKLYVEEIMVSIRPLDHYSHELNIISNMTVLITLCFTATPVLLPNHQ